MSTGGGDPVQVTQEGGWFTRMSVDGRTLFFGKPQPEWGVYRMPVEGGAPELFLPDGRIDLFAPAANGYYFWRMKGSVGSVFGYPDGSLVFLDSSTGARRLVTVTDLGKGRNLNSEALTRSVNRKSRTQPQGSVSLLRRPDL